MEELHRRLRTLSPMLNVGAPGPGGERLGQPGVFSARGMDGRRQRRGKAEQVERQKGGEGDQVFGICSRSTGMVLLPGRE